MMRCAYSFKNNRDHQVKNVIKSSQAIILLHFRLGTRCQLEKPLVLGTHNVMVNGSDVNAKPKDASDCGQYRCSWESSPM